MPAILTVAVVIYAISTSADILSRISYTYNNNIEGEGEGGSEREVRMILFLFDGAHSNPTVYRAHAIIFNISGCAFDEGKRCYIQNRRAISRCLFPREGRGKE